MLFRFIQVEQIIEIQANYDEVKTQLFLGCLVVVVVVIIVVMVLIVIAVHIGFD